MLASALTRGRARSAFCRGVREQRAFDIRHYRALDRKLNLELGEKELWLSGAVVVLYEVE